MSEPVLIHLLLLAVPPPPLLKRLWAGRIHGGLDRAQSLLAQSLILGERNPCQDWVKGRHPAVAHR